MDFVADLVAFPWRHIAWKGLADEAAGMRRVRYSLRRPRQSLKEAIEMTDSFF